MYNSFRFINIISYRKLLPARPHMLNVNLNSEKFYAVSTPGSPDWGWHWQTLWRS